MPLFAVTTHEVIFRTYIIKADSEDAARGLIQDTESDAEREALSVKPVDVGEDENGWEVLDIYEVEDSEQAAEERKASK